jgi:ketosteroid isomerase-like protein
VPAVYYGGTSLPRVGWLLDHVRSYYEALNSGDPDRVAEHFTEDAVHYYTRLGPHEGARAIGEHTLLAVETLGGRWFIEDAVDDGERVVIEWTMTWRDPGSGEPRLDRGTEWFEFRDGKIAEVRAYHHSNEKNRSGDLIGFDHAGRGYTML